MVGGHAPGTWSRIRDTFVLPLDNTKKIVQPYDNPPSTSSNSYSMAQLDFLTVHDVPVAAGLLKSTHDFEETVRRERSVSASGNFSIGFAEAAISATAAFLGDKRRAFELFHQSWQNAWLDPFGMIRETPVHDYGCFLTNYGSLLQTAIFWFTDLPLSEVHCRKYPASFPPA